MERKHLHHAEKVVEAFKQKLSQSGRDHVGEKHFDELTLMIESAVSTSVLEAVEGATHQISDLIEKIKKDAEHV